MNLTQFESLFEQKITQTISNDDPAHDLLHFKRVVALAKKLATEEKANLDIIIPAAWLHDVVNVPKDSPLRKQASRLSAQGAIKYLTEINYPEKYFEAIAHAIEAHSFSAGIEAKTLEAQVVQDADRLDGIGAIGIARCFLVAGMLKRSLYSEVDPFAQTRELNDNVYTIDHFYKKLFVVANSLKTNSGKLEGKRRLEIMSLYLEDLKKELS